jgi:Uma2 family endonuclease
MAVRDLDPPFIPPPPDGGLYTVDDFIRLVPDGQKADLIDGVIYMSSPDTNRSDDLTNFVHFLIDGFAAARKLGRVKGSRYAFALTRHRAPEPDVAFVSTARQAILEERAGSAGPDIAVEVVARDSRSRDYKEKFRLYREAGVAEYWIIDPRQRCALFHRLEAGEYLLMPLADERIFRSAALPGFWLDVTWLLADPLPNRWDCLQQILAGDPPSSQST